MLSGVTLFEPLFLLCVLSLFASLFRLVSLLVRGRPARSLVLRIAAGTGAYFAALLTVSALSEAGIYAPGEPQCFDDWCLTVDRFERNQDSLRVHLNVISEAKRVTQRESGVEVTLIDEHGRVYRPTAEFGTPIDTAIGPGERFGTGRVYALEAGSRELAVVLKHGGPGPLIIGDRGSLFHRRSRMLLPAPTR